MADNKSTNRTADLKELFRTYEKGATIGDMVSYADKHRSLYTICASMALAEWRIVLVNKNGLVKNYLGKQEITEADLNQLFLGQGPYEIPSIPTYGIPTVTVNLREIKFDNLDKEIFSGLVKDFTNKRDAKRAVVKIDDYLSIDGKPTTFFTKGMSLGRRLLESDARSAGWFSGYGIRCLGTDLKTELGLGPLEVALLDLFEAKPEVSKVRSPITFEDIGGYKEVKQIISRDVVNVLRAKVERPELLNFGARLPRGVILHGPPGTGKSMFLDAIGNEFKGAIGKDKILVEPYRLEQRMYLGESERVLKESFDRYRKLAESNPQGLVVILLDEAEGTFEKRSDDSHETTKRQIGRLLSYMNGTEELPENVLFVAATNLLKDIDPAFLRPGRFSYHCEIGYPDLDGASQIFAKKLSAVNAKMENGDFKEVADYAMKQIPNCTGSDIKNVVERAAGAILSEFMKLEPKIWKTESTERLRLNKDYVKNFIDVVATEKKKKAEATSRSYDHEKLKTPESAPAPGMFS